MSTEPIPHDPAAARLAELFHAAAERPPVCLKCNDSGTPDKGATLCNCFAGRALAADWEREQADFEETVRDVWCRR